MKKLYVVLLAAVAQLSSVSAERVIVGMQHVNHRSQGESEQMTITYDQEGHVATEAILRDDGVSLTRNYTYDWTAGQIVIKENVMEDGDSWSLETTSHLQDGLVYKYSVKYDGEEGYVAECVYDSDRHLITVTDREDYAESIMEYTWADGDLVSHTESWDGEVQILYSYTYGNTGGEPLLSAMVLNLDVLADTYSGLFPYLGLATRHMPVRHTMQGEENGDCTIDYDVDGQGRIIAMRFYENSKLCDTYTIEWADLQFASVNSVTAQERISSTSYSLGGCQLGDGFKGVVIRDGKKVLHKIP